MLFRCIKRDKKGYIQEDFFREGESEQEVLEGLELFCWDEKGEWEVYDPNAQEW